MAELGETMRAKASLLAIVGLTGSALVAGGGVQACAQGSGNTEQDISPTDESGELGGGGQSGQPTTGGSTGGLVVDGGVGDGALDDASACAADTFPGVLVPLDLYIMLDRSSSMDDGVKWPAVTSALQTFVTSPDCDGIGVGIQYFPVPPTDPIPVGCTTGADCGYYGPCLIAVCAGALAPDTSCDPVDYDSADVSIAELPGVF